MRRNRDEQIGPFTSNEIKEVKYTLKRTGIGVLVLPFRGNESLLGHLIPYDSIGQADQKTFDRFTERLREMGCTKMFMVSGSGPTLEISFDKMHASTETSSQS